MKSTFAILMIALAFMMTASVAMAQQLAWAYGIAPPRPEGAAPPTKGPPDTSVHHLPGSTMEYTRAQLSNFFAPQDWFPGDHPAMPEIVAQGRKPDARRCSMCHYPNGFGRPENAAIAGLPVSYFIQQIKDFRSGARKSAEPRKSNTTTMIEIATALTDAEVKQAAEYFASVKYTKWQTVVEGNMVPKMRIGGMYVKLPGDEKEPLGQRVIVTPTDPEGTGLFNSRSGFTVYVPEGSIKKGEALVTKGMGKTEQCGLCHGADLKGLGPVPPLAGRGASYVARQMYDMQQGARKGVWSDLMKPVVAKLSEEDIVNITAYTASLAP